MSILVVLTTTTRTTSLQRLRRIGTTTIRRQKTTTPSSSSSPTTSNNNNNSNIFAAANMKKSYYASSLARGLACYCCVGFTALSRLRSASSFAFAATTANGFGGGGTNGASASTTTTALLSAATRTALFSTKGGGGAKSSSPYDPSSPPFQTWTFDKPCQHMEWNELAPVDLAVVVAMSDGGENNADLVLIGVTAPPKEEKGEDEDSDEDSDNGDEDGKDESPADVVLTGAAAELDESAALGGALSELLRENSKSFKNGAKLGATSPTLRVAGAVTADGKKISKRYVAVGLGPTPSPESEDGGDDDEKKKKQKKKKDPWDGAGHALGKALAAKCEQEKKVATASIVLPAAMVRNETIMSDFACSFYQSLYADNRFKTGSKIKKVAEDLVKVAIVPDGTVDDDAAAAAEAALDRGKKLATGISLTKDIVNSPHNVLNSVSLADTARRIAAESKGRITCTVYNKRECEKRGMGAFLGVARGSETEPQFIHLTYKPSSSSSSSKRKKVGIVGKGLLFDTGGYNIKTAMMEAMKFDCGGAAAVLGAARAVGELQPDNVEAHFFVAACENMINDKAVVPSDILTASNGKTIEVMNTDAEGRLTLADALVFADKEIGCEKIIELSTLTGACMISLGKSIAGLWTKDDDLAAELDDISKLTGDKTWRMPMEQSYNEQLESKFADLKNIGTRYGGAITAALFLQNFCSKKKPFAHIDIAGPVWSDKTGATGTFSVLRRDAKEYCGAYIA